ncbi:MAG: cyclic pyranopterin monophosphate synthase MoaC [Acidimicrobiia bacterium]|nr:cyclic pyranopterin monophosphate synthase MoaC [Acidimicrobiia bacterium]
MAEGFSHLDEAGHARMVDVSTKNATVRVATAEAHVSIAAGVRERLFGGDLPKGDALGVARVAAIMAAKRTSTLVPLCHPIPIEAIEVEIEETSTGARFEVVASTTAKTGIEMEAITAASIGAVALYDMIKGLDRSAEIGPVRLLSKSGGKSGDWSR